jgi:hypothetical protein
MRNNSREALNKININSNSQSSNSSAGVLGGIKNTISNFGNYIFGGNQEADSRELRRIEEEQVESNTHSVQPKTAEDSNRETLEKKQKNCTKNNFTDGQKKFAGFGVKQPQADTNYDDAWPKIDKILQEKYQEAKIKYTTKHIDNVPARDEEEIQLDQIDEKNTIINKNNFSMSELNTVKMEVRRYNQSVLKKYSNDPNSQQKYLLTKYNPHDVDYHLTKKNFENLKKSKNSQLNINNNNTQTENSNSNSINQSSGKKNSTLINATQPLSNFSSSNKRSSSSRNIHSENSSALQVNLFNYNYNQQLPNINIGRNSQNSEVRSNFHGKRNYSDCIASGVISQDNLTSDIESINRMLKNPTSRDVMNLLRKNKQIEHENNLMRLEKLRARQVKTHANQQRQFNLAELKMESVSSTNVEIKSCKNENTLNNFNNSQSEVRITQLADNFQSMKPIDSQSQVNNIIIEESSSSGSASISISNASQVPLQAQGAVSNFKEENKENLAEEFICRDNLHKVEEAKEEEECSPAYNMGAGSNFSNIKKIVISRSGSKRGSIKDVKENIIEGRKSRNNSADKNEINSTNISNSIIMTNTFNNPSVRKIQNVDKNIMNNPMAMGSVKKSEIKDYAMTNINPNPSVTNLEGNPITTSNTNNIITFKKPESKSKTEESINSIGNRTSFLNNSNTNISNISNSSSSSGILTNSLNNTVVDVVELSNNSTIKESVEEHLESQSQAKSEFQVKSISSVPILNNIQTNTSVSGVSSKAKDDVKDFLKTQVTNNANSIQPNAPLGVFKSNNQPTVPSNSNSNTLVTANNPFLLASNNVNKPINNPSIISPNITVNNNINNPFLSNSNTLSSNISNSMTNPMTNAGSNTNSNTNTFKNLFGPVAPSTNNNNPIGGNLHNPTLNNNLNFLTNNPPNTISNASPQSISSTVTFAPGNVNSGFSSTTHLNTNITPNLNTNFNSNLNSNNFPAVTSNNSNTGNNFMYSNYQNNNQTNNMNESYCDMPIDNSPPKTSNNLNNFNSLYPNHSIQGNNLNNSFQPQQTSGVNNYYNNNNQAAQRLNSHAVNINTNPFTSNNNMNNPSSSGSNIRPAFGGGNNNLMNNPAPFNNHGVNNLNNNISYPQNNQPNNFSSFNNMNNHVPSHQPNNNLGWGQNPFSSNNTNTNFNLNNNSGNNLNSNFNSNLNKNNPINPNPFLSSGQNQKEQKQSSIFEVQEPSIYRRRK